MFVIAVGLSVASTQVGAGDGVPPGWMLGGQGYEAGLDGVTKHGGRAGAFLRSKGRGAGEFGTLMQMIDAAAYRGSRVRLSGFSKSVDVTGWAGFWLRVDGPTSVLAFDNMQARPIKGTADWKRDDVVLDIPPEARALAFGVLLAGAGQLWVDDLQLEVVDRSVAVTASAMPR
jgi:hypothetical protein